MRHSQKFGFGIINVILAMLFSVNVMAASAAQDDAPRAVIEGATDQLLAAIEASKDSYAEDPGKFEAAIDEIMLPLVDFRSFARAVMGRHGSKKAYEALQSDEERAAFDARVDRFTSKFKTGLIATYSKGLITFSGGDIKVMPSKLSKKSKSALVVQQVHSNAGTKPITIRYKLRPNDAGDWLIRNVHIQTVNLGKVYRSQFKAALKEHRGDVDKVIETWVVESTDLEQA